MSGTGSLHSRMAGPVRFMSVLSSTGLIELGIKIGISSGLLQLVSVLNQIRSCHSGLFMPLLYRLRRLCKLPHIPEVKLNFEKVLHERNKALIYLAQVCIW